MPHEPLSPRAELLRLHRQIYRRNKAVIEESVIHEDRQFRAYERRYRRAVADYEKIITVEESFEAVLKSRLVYVGDYHTLNQSQRSLLRLMRLLIDKKRLVLCMEVIQSRHQDVLDRYMQGKISDEVFLRQIGFREHWFFDLWPNFKPIFDFARENNIKVVAMEADVLQTTALAARDRAMASVIHETCRNYPEHHIIVFIGDLHLAPAHLPREVRRLFGAHLPPTLTLFQNSDSIYWKLADQELEDKTLVVKISDAEHCRMHTPPIICQQSFLNWLEHEEGIFDFADARQTFMSYLEQIAAYLGIKPGPEKDEVEVFTCGDLSFLKRLREDKGFTPSRIARIKKRILTSQSYYIPERKFVYLANVSVNHAAFEAARILCHLCAGESEPKMIQDIFYAGVIREALGYFGSKIINHRRKCLRPADAASLCKYWKVNAQGKGRPFEYEAALLFLEQERGGLFSPTRLSRFSSRLIAELTAGIGRYLGEQMFYGLLAEKISKESIAELFSRSFSKEGEAGAVFESFKKKLGKVKLPSKF